MLAACGDSGKTTTTASTVVPGVTSTLVQPATRLSGDLKILQWSHFVPRHDTWFDPFAKSWGTPRSAQTNNPAVAADVYFTSPLRGAQTALASEHTMGAVKG